MQPGRTTQRDAPRQAYYLGALVIMSRPDHTTEVFDGMQRLTTLSILISVLRDLLLRNEAMALRLHALVAVDADAERSPFRLKLQGRDETLKRQVQPWGESIRNRKTAPYSDMGERIRAAARLCRDAITPWSDERRSYFATCLLERVKVTLVDAGYSALARQIFVTTNQRGVPLDQVDLFKGQLMDIAGDDATAQQVLSHWSRILDLMGKGLPELLLAVDFIERQQPQGADCLTDLTAYLATTYPGPKILAWLGRLSLFANAWLELKAKLQNCGPEKLDHDIWRLQIFEWDEWKPLALLWYGDYCAKRHGKQAWGSKAALERRFDALHRRAMAVSLALLSSSDRAMVFRRAIEQTNTGLSKPLTGALAFTQMQLTRIKQTLRLPLVDEELRRTLIRWLEAQMWNQAFGPPIPHYVAKATLEHILPRRPAPGSQWVADFPDEEERYNRCHSLGNMAALDYDTNKRIANLDFAAKRDIIQRNAKPLRMLADILRATRWTSAEIEARAEHLAQFTWEELALPPAVAAPAPRARAGAAAGR